jgi:gas vesicle protein
MTRSQLFSFAAGLASGLIVGAATVILLAPQSGPETQQRIRNKVTEIIEAGRQAVTERRQELEREYQARIQIPLSPAKPESQ